MKNKKNKRKLVLMIQTKGKTPQEIKDEAVRILNRKRILNKHGRLNFKNEHNNGQEK